jgi:hypothetical protein
VQSLGRYLIILGITIAVIGAAVTFFPKMNFFGKLPGDIIIKRDNYTLQFPIVTCILLSVGFSFIFWLINIFLKK